jgi:hypothetical protein
LSWSKILSLMVLCTLQDRVPYEATVNPAAALARLDFSCLLRTWKIKGVLWCGPLGAWPCLWVENAYPCGLLEVVRQPWKSHVVPLPPGPPTTGGHQEDQLRYGEGRVFTFVPPLVQATEIPVAAPPGPIFLVNYLSELDAVGWRTGLLDLLMTPACGPVGAWGCAFPRAGFVQQPSEPLAAHLQAVRAGLVAAQPLGRVVLAPYPFEPRVGHHLQMVSPLVRACTTIGNFALPALEAGAGSPWGAYLFVHWGLFEECKRCLPPRLVPPRLP